MKLNLNGIEIELPNNAKVDVSSDGKNVKIDLPEAEVVEKIRFVEVPSDEVVERIRIIEVEKPCHQPHYPSYPGYPWTITTSGDNNGGVIYGGTVTTGNIQTFPTGEVTTSSIGEVTWNTIHN